MRLHVVTDIPAVARAAVLSGATVVQLRMKSVSTQARVIAGAGFAGLGATLIVNDDVEAAIRLDADGVHLGQDDPGAEAALAAGLLLGRSVSTVEEAVAAERGGAGYLGAGPVWSTPSKTDAVAAIGVDGLARICAAVRIPVVAIGGIDAGTAAECIRAGCAGVAVMRAATDCAALRAAVDPLLDPVRR